MNHSIKLPATYSLYSGHVKEVSVFLTEAPLGESWTKRNEYASYKFPLNWKEMYFANKIDGRGRTVLSSCSSLLEKPLSKVFE